MGYSQSLRINVRLILFFALCWKCGPLGTSSFANRLPAGFLNRKEYQKETMGPEGESWAISVLFLLWAPVTAGPSSIATASAGGPFSEPPLSHRLLATPFSSLSYRPEGQ